MIRNILHEIKTFFILLFRIFTNIKLVGLMTIFAYITVILFTWISTNINGHIYFSAGEPIWYIKYTEWGLAINGLYWLLRVIKEHIDLNSIKFNVGI